MTSPSKHPTPPPQPPKGGDGNRADPSGYAEAHTEKEQTGRGLDKPVQRSPVVPKK